MGFLRAPWDNEATARQSTDQYGKKLYSATEEADRRVVDRVTEAAAARGVSQSQIALAWILQKPGVVAPIIGATKMHHLEDAVNSLSLKLTEDEVRRLEEPYIPHAASFV